MSYDLSINKQFQLAGKPYNHTQTLSKDDLFAKEESVQIAWQGVLTTRTDANTGSLTMTDVGHLITTAAKVDIYWTNADGTNGQRRGVTVGTVAALVVPIDLGAGDDLPIATTVVQVALVKVFALSSDLVGDDVEALVAAVDFAKGTIVLMSTGDTVEELYIGILASGAYGWTGDGTNPIATKTIDTVHFSHNDIATVRNVRVAALLAP